MKFDVDLFNRTYRGTRWFSDESKYFTEFLKDIQNAELMSHLRFCNDFLQTPPIFAYVRFRRDLYTGSLEKKRETCARRMLRLFVSIRRIYRALRSKQRSQRLGGRQSDGDQKCKLFHKEEFRS